MGKEGKDSDQPMPVLGEMMMNSDFSQWMDGMYRTSHQGAPQGGEAQGAHESHELRGVQEAAAVLRKGWQPENKITRYEKSGEIR